MGNNRGLWEVAVRLRGGVEEVHRPGSGLFEFTSYGTPENHVACIGYRITETGALEVGTWWSPGIGYNGPVEERHFRSQITYAPLAWVSIEGGLAFQPER